MSQYKPEILFLKQEDVIKAGLLDMKMILEVTEKTFKMIGEGQVIVAFKTAFMVKRANREDYYKFTDAALSQILGGTYHMQGFLEGDAELDG